MARAHRPTASTRAVDVNDDAWRHRLLAAAMVGVTAARSSPGLDREAHDDRITTALAAARYQVIPSRTAAMAAARTAIVAVSTVTARADHRNSRSRRACETAARGKAEGIAGRISTRISGGGSVEGARAQTCPRPQ